MVNEIYDLSRSLILTIRSWFYHVDYPEIHHQETTNVFPLSEKSPFKVNRREWVISATKTIIDRLTAIMIDEFGGRGIQGPPGKSKGSSIDWNYRIINAVFKYEEGVVKVPQDVLDRIERLEGLIADSMKAIEEYEDMIADILAKKEEERTVEDKEKLLRLDGYIRSEKENIRKFEFEIKRLKTEWNIE